MGTKLQLKQRCKELEEMLENAENQRDSYATLANSRQAHIENLKAVLEKERAWNKIEKNRIWFYVRCLTKLRYIMALDIVEQATHRERNEKWRHWQDIVFQWIHTENFDTEINDDIPF